VFAHRRVRRAPRADAQPNPFRLVYRSAPSGGAVASESILSIHLPHKGAIKDLFTVDKAIPVMYLKFNSVEIFKT
jgi:hypothetical protein